MTVAKLPGSTRGQATSLENEIDRAWLAERAFSLVYRQLVYVVSIQASLLQLFCTVNSSFSVLRTAFIAQDKLADKRNCVHMNIHSVRRSEFSFSFVFSNITGTQRKDQEGKRSRDQEQYWDDDYQPAENAVAGRVAHVNVVSRRVLHHLFRLLVEVVVKCAC